MHFTKMHGLGNDYICLDCSEEIPKGLSAMAVRISDRHTGAGADGLIAICPGRTGDFSMVMYNADGSIGEMCGNGIRCLGKYVFDRGLTDRTVLTIDTAAGPRNIVLHVTAGRTETVTVDMEKAFLLPEITLTVENIPFRGVPVSMGNPHFVIFCSDPEQADVHRFGPLLEHHPLFPNRTNVEWVAVGRDQLTIRVWERGSGETLACGTGACAAFSATYAKGLCTDRIKARLPGGVLELSLETETNHIMMTGPAVTVYDGEWPEL